MGFPLLRKGDFIRAIMVLERARSIAQIGNLPFMHNFAASLLGFAYALGGRIEEGIALLEQTAEQSASLGMMFCHASSMTYLCETYLLANRIDEAADTAGRALQLCRDHKIRGYEAWTQYILGNIASHQQKPETDKAQMHYHQALDLANALDMRPLIAHCYLGLGTLYRRAEKPELAQGHLTKASTMFREMDMRSYLEKAEAEIKKLG